MIPHLKGIYATQAHVGIPDGLYEEEVGRNGFFGNYAHLYRKHAPISWTRIEGELKPRSYDFNKVTVKEGDYLRSRVPYFYNSDVVINFVQFDQTMNYFFRNADGDEMLFCHHGQGTIQTDYGPLDYEEGDYIIVPRGTVYRLLVKAPTQMLVVESMSEFTLPDKGLLGQHALFDPAVMKIPTPQDISSTLPVQAEYEVRVKRCNEMTKIFYPYCPIDIVGWKGTLTAWKINMRDIRPISCDRYHLPPTAHITFVAHNFVVCSFLPRPLENGDPLCVKVPFYHSNIDFDEVIFYHRGEFFSRTGVGQGMLTFHPQGIHHGPQEGAVKRSAAATHTNEMAVMIDTKRPLMVAPGSSSIENQEYWKSWMTK